MKIKRQFVFAVLSILALAGAGAPVQSQDPREDLSLCPGSAPQPTQSAEWAVAFCNRTGHDLVIEFHDNECPASGWTRRGDVYQRTLRRGESRTLPLCYANEPAGKKPPPGIPTLRIPGGKGVTTTWTVVGDCGDHSSPLNTGAQTFYDRGDFTTGIILLQNPAGQSHCTSDVASNGGPSLTGSYVGANGAGVSANGATPADVSAASRAAAANGAGVSGAAGANAAAGANGGTGVNGAAGANGGGVATSPAYAAAPGATTTPAYAAPGAPAAVNAPPNTSAPRMAASTPYNVTGAAAAPAVPRTGGEPALTASIPTSGLIQHSVQIFAKGGAGYRCNLNLLVTFSDGATWNDKTKVDITGNDEQAPIAIKKYLKTPTDVKITSNKCAPL